VVRGAAGGVTASVCTVVSTATMSSSASVEMAAPPVLRSQCAKLLPDTSKRMRGPGKNAFEVIGF
jgi:hypothetical protein